MIDRNVGELRLWGKLGCNLWEDRVINWLAVVHRGNSRLRHALHEFRRIGARLRPDQALRVTFGDRAFHAVARLSSICKRRITSRITSVALP